MIINEASLLLGKELEYVERGHLVIEGTAIKSAGQGSYAGKGKVLDGRGFLIIPGFINAHTHIADSIGKDIASGQGLDARVHPVSGAKKKILESPPEQLQACMRTAAILMMKKGTVAFADFREGGPEGIRLLKDALVGLPTKCIALGRASYLSEPAGSSGLQDHHIQEAKEVLQLSEGLGISGANENTDLALSQYRQLAGNKLLAIHAAESKETVRYSREHAGRGEVERVLQHMRPDFVVHMTQASDEEISLAAKSRTGVVLCPRANGVLGAGVPRINKMLQAGCLVALGTDNVMLNSPDMTRELDYAWKASRATEGAMIAPREILKMATANAAEILRLNSGWIEQGRSADLIFIDKRDADLFPMHDPYAALVHRLSESSISAVMINGRFVAEIFN